MDRGLCKTESIHKVQKNLSYYIRDIISSKEVAADNKLHSLRHLRQTKFEKCFLPCSSETFAFSSATQKFKVSKF